jgi:flagellar protein FlaG
MNEIRNNLETGSLFKNEVVQRQTIAGQPTPDGKELPPGVKVERTVQVRAISPEPATLTSSAEALEQVVRQLNAYVENAQRNLRFSVDQASGKPVVAVVESSSGEVIRQIPGDVALRVARNLNVDSKANGSTAQSEAHNVLVTLGLIDTRA